MSVIGFLGTGRIAGAVVSGLCDSSSPPDRILLSPRNADVARSLAQRYPTVRVTKDNGEVVTSSDIVVVGLPPEKAEAALGELRFRAEQRVVSVMAMIPGERIVKMVSPAGVVRVLPLPSISQAMGPIVIHPSVRWATELFSPLGEVLTVEDEAQLDTIWSGTSVIAAQIEQIALLARVLEDNGVPSSVADSYARSMLASVYTHAASSPASLSSLLEEAQTPGGLNQQVLHQLRIAGTYDALQSALNNVIRRIRAGML